MIEILLQAATTTIGTTSGYILPDSIWYAIGILFTILGYLTLVWSGYMPVVLRKFKVASGDNSPSTTVHSLASLITAEIQIGNVLFPIPPDAGIETIKRDETTGNVIRRYNFYTGDGALKYKDASDDKIQVELNDDLLDGRGMVFRYVGEGELSTVEQNNVSLRKKLEDANAMIERLKEELSESKRPASWQNMRKRQRLKSSRFFTPEDRLNSMNDEEVETGDVEEE